MDTTALCFRLAALDGTSGDEIAAAKDVQALFAAYMKTETDTLGNVRGTLGDGEFRILLDAHIDRVGLVVRGIDEKGFLLIDKVGGVDPRVLVGSEVTVMGAKALSGVICSTPPHLLTKEQKEAGVELKQLAIDIGMNKEEAESVISVGDRVALPSNQLRLLCTRIAGSGFDDRCGIAVLYKVIEAVHDQLKHCTLILQCSVQEEVGGNGARTGAYQTDADCAIAVDVGFGADPYCDKTETIVLGKGPSIGLAPVLDRALTQELIGVAKKYDIPYQHDVMGGTTGTNADDIQLSRGGIKTALLSIPLRSMHTSVEVIDTVDIDNSAKLLASFILEKEAQLA